MREFYRQREGQGTLLPVQVNPLVTQLRDLTRPRWEAIPQQHGITIGLQLDLNENLPAVQGIESEMREALTNLIFNAVDAMPAGVVLTLRTRQLDAQRVCVEVIDTGTGMNEATRESCLEPFFTTKGERGTGLGLAMVYGVMQRHGGEVQIDSVEGAGTTMRLCFMTTDVEPAPQPVASIEVPRELDLLLVDDDPILLNSLREILQLDGHRIRTASGGQAGIEMFRDSLLPGGSPIDLVITDLGMPHVDGRQVAGAIKLASPATPVVMLTGWGERLLAEARTPPHVDRVLGKPPRLRELRAALAELAGGE
jgi:CheY-like chemotaxis protein/anti-sigma regulatory factor (Ser/Thr protein kinase)